MGGERILYEDEYLSAINKMPGELVQPDRKNSPSLSELIPTLSTGPRAPEQFFAPIHRLDRPVSGIVLFAKDRNFFTAMTRIFQEKKAEKIYWAVVEKAPAEKSALLAHHVAADRKKNKTFVKTDGDPSTANALLEYRLIGNSERYFFLVVRLITGKQHQIRAQLAAAGMPIRGDVKYGARRGNPDRSIHLHARSIGFTHPVTEQSIELTAPPPKDILWELFASAAFAHGHK
jgi:23S rRNA pseudouridine1911/1915/1917 synthase